MLFSAVMAISSKLLSLICSNKPCLATCHGLCAVIWYFTGEVLAIWQFDATVYCLLTLSPLTFVAILVSTSQYSTTFCLLQDIFLSIQTATVWKETGLHSMIEFATMAEVFKQFTKIACETMGFFFCIGVVNRSCCYIRPWTWGSALLCSLFSV